jgi:hypothetical protein
MTTHTKRQRPRRTPPKATTRLPAPLLPTAGAAPAARAHDPSVRRTRAGSATGTGRCAGACATAEPWPSQCSATNPSTATSLALMISGASSSLRTANARIQGARRSSPASAQRARAPRDRRALHRPSGPRARRWVRRTHRRRAIDAGVGTPTVKAVTFSGRWPCSGSVVWPSVNVTTRLTGRGRRRSPVGSTRSTTADGSRRCAALRSGHARLRSATCRYISPCGEFSRSDLGRTLRDSLHLTCATTTGATRTYASLRVRAVGAGTPVVEKVHPLEMRKARRYSAGLQSHGDNEIAPSGCSSATSRASLISLCT